MGEDEGELVGQERYVKLDDYIQKIAKFTTGFSNVPCVRILTFGEIGSGKSSFTNSVLSMLDNRIRQLLTVRRSKEAVTLKVMQNICIIVCIYISTVKPLTYWQPLFVYFG